jgi:hypothetical protein
LWNEELTIFGKKKETEKNGVFLFFKPKKNAIFFSFFKNTIENCEILLIGTQKINSLIINILMYFHLN